MRFNANTVKPLALAASALVAGMAMAWGAPIADVSYVYNNLGELTAIAGKDAPDGAEQALTDGVGKSGAYTPSNYFWEPGGEGTIYYHKAADLGVKAQPRVTFDLGGSFKLETVTIHYGVRQASGIHAPVSVDISIDGNFVGSFGGFNDSGNGASGGFGAIRLNQINLTGQTGQLITLELRGNSSTGAAGVYVGLTEVEFGGVPVTADDPNLLVPARITLATVAKSPASTARSFQVINTGETNILNVTGLTFTGANAAAFTAGILPTGIAANGGTGMVNLTFNSGGVVGTYTATAHIISNDASSPATTELTIVVEEGPILAVPLEVDLGTVAVSPPVTRQLSISNAAQATTLNISEVSFIGADATKFTLGSFPSSLVAGAASNITFTFDSGGSSGFFEADCQIISDDPSSPTYIRVIVMVEEGPLLDVPDNLNLGTVYTGTGLQAKSIRVRNAALATALNISGISFSDVSGGATWTVDSFSGNLAAGASGDIVLTFDTAVGIGTYTAELVIVSDDPSEDSGIVQLKITVSTVPTGANAYQQAVINDLPVLYWNFDESGATDDAIDVMTGAIENDLQPSGNASRIVSDIGLGNTANFDSISDDYFFSNSLNTGQTTYGHYAVELWVRLDNAVRASYILKGGSASTEDNSPALIHGYNPNLEGYFQAGGRTGSAGPKTLTDNAWHHVVLEVNIQTNTHRLYIDGVLKNTYPGSRTWKLPVLAVGATQFGNEGIDGQIDELAFYDLSGGLTGQDIANHFRVVTGGGDEFVLVVDSYNASTHEIKVSAKNIPAGQSFHLRSSIDLQSFSPLSPPLNFNSTTPQPFLIDSGGAPKLFLQAFDGVSP